MPSLVAVNVVQVVMGYLSGGEPAENVYHVHKASAWSAPEINDLLTVFSDWESTTAKSKRSDQVQLVRLTGTDLTSLTSDRVDIALVAPIAGTNVSPVMPANVTFAVKANIGERGKGRNGRTFWIGLAENKCLNNSIDETAAGDIQTALNTLITDVLSGPPAANLGIIHTQAAGLPISPASFTPILTFTYTDLFLDSQKNRLPGHKRHKRPTT
jgi:hypothetical protein